ncbi:MAG TPA: SGNH/GDSL hydrolase family protein [Acidobacteriaceae bacterium]
MAASSAHWVGTWAASPLGQANVANLFSSDTTLREIVHVSLAGSTLRVALSNELGTESLRIGGVTVAMSGGSGSVEPGTTALTFNGQHDVTIPPGAMVLSDAASFKLPAFGDLAVSIFVPGQTIKTLSNHPLALQTSYLAPGNQVGSRTLNSSKEIFAWEFLKGVQVMGTDNSGSVVTLGDSITDGAQSTRNANARWPDLLAKRLQANKKTANLSVLNEGISGNRLLHDNAGPSALARFDRDVLAQPNVRYLILLEGINDIGRTAQPRDPGDPINTTQLLGALQQIIDRAHAHGIKVYGATLTPYEGAKYASPDGIKMRQAENDFIRGGKFDGVIDFDKLTRDPAHPGMYLPANDSGDHLHPNDTGYKAMGEGIDLKLFEH